MEGKESDEKNWSEKVEDLIDSGEIDAAISLLETLIPKFETLISSDSQSQLTSALFELSKLYSSKGLSLKSDQLSSRASAIKDRSLFSTRSSGKDGVSRVCDASSLRCAGSSSTNDDVELVSKPSNNNVASVESADDDDDWEALADCEPDELLSVSPRSIPEPEVAKLSLSDTKAKGPRRRGRGNFTYRKEGLHSDRQDDDYGGYDSPDEAVLDKPEKLSEARKAISGTRHVLVLDGFDPSTTTTDLEKLLEDFSERGFSIRWVNDTLALAVFQSPTSAREALNSIRCSFSVRVMEEDDSILGSVSVKDLDPPRQRPKTSARTAQRLIAQELGVKLPSNFGSRELRKQEDARRNRIVARQTLRDEAWGPDDTK